MSPARIPPAITKNVAVNKLQILGSSQKSKYCRLFMWRVPHAVNHRLGVIQSSDKLATATKLLNVLERESAKVLVFVNVTYGSHARTQDDLGMIFEEVNLLGKNAIS